jgi:hypothetical protein
MSRTITDAVCVADTLNIDIQTVRRIVRKFAKSVRRELIKRGIRKGDI